MINKIKDFVLRNRFDTIEKYDSDFGQMRFIEFREQTKQYWECKGIFKPTGDTVIFLIGSLTDKGPETKQREFFQRIVLKFGKISKVIKQNADEFLDSKYSNYTPTDLFKEQFAIKTISLQINSWKSGVWEISFSPKSGNKSLYITAYMNSCDILKLELES